MDSWHSRSQADLFQELDARPGGLTRRQAEERLARYGPNQLEPPRRPGLLSRVMAQMKDPMILVLLAAAACAPLGTWDSVVNVAVSFVCALQVEAFRKVHGHAFASTMCTGNLRSGTEALYRCVSEQAPGSLRTAGCYFAVIACFLCGAALGGLLLPVLGQWTVLVAAAEQAAGFVWMWIR